MSSITNKITPKITNKIISKISFSTIWGLCGAANILYIAPITIYTSCSRIKKSTSKNWPDLSLPKRALSILWLSTISVIGTGITTGFKSICYGILGPIGTYRIGLANYNRYITGDERWTYPVHTYAALMKSEDGDEKYFMQPVGNASWIPVNK